MKIVIAQKKTKKKQLISQMSADEVIDCYKDHPSVKAVKQSSNNKQQFNFTHFSQSIVFSKLKQLQPNKAT